MYSRWLLVDYDAPCLAAFHSKHNFASDENNGHDMGYRISLTIEELGELSASITKASQRETARD